MGEGRGTCKGWGREGEVQRGLDYLKTDYLSVDNKCPVILCCCCRCPLMLGQTLPSLSCDPTAQVFLSSKPKLKGNYHLWSTYCILGTFQVQINPHTYL